MKVFWALIAVLVLGAAVMALRGGGGESARGPRDEAASRDEAGPVAAPAPEPIAALAPEPEAGTPEVAAAEPPGETASQAPGDSSAMETAVPTEAAAEPAPEPAAPAAAEPEVAAAAPASPDDDTKTEAALPAELEKMVADTIGSSEAPATPKPAADAAAPAAGGAAEAAGAAAPTIVDQADGSKLINDRFLLKGEGTKEKPYEVTWDFLISAQETYKPRLGQKTLPAYLDLINGKYVKVSGYIAFPLMAQSADEMLVMLNQWDGCCIGIPPTPYDAVEVRLNTAAEGETRFKVAGSVTGKLAVDPYLVKDWLIGLYTMEDAELRTEN